MVNRLHRVNIFGKTVAKVPASRHRRVCRNSNHVAILIHPLQQGECNCTFNEKPLRPRRGAGADVVGQRIILSVFVELFELAFECVDAQVDGFFECVGDFRCKEVFAVRDYELD